MAQLIADRYRIVRELGRGAQGATYLAMDERGGEQVALKELDFAGIGSWDTVNLFEREAAVLGGLVHLGIPRIRESFRVEEDGSVRLFLAQDFVPGDDLQKRLVAGALFDERRLRAIAASVLEILTYLHGHSPPVLHRDVKPANLIERPDGSLALVDFGAAQGSPLNSPQGTAVIGTTGYMPAEQLMGRARPQSDLFALGATLIHLATRKHPAELGEGLGLSWRRFANLSAPFADWLDRLVAPMPEDRFPSAFAAQRALEALDGRRRPAQDLVAVDEVHAVLPWEQEVAPPVPSEHGRYALSRRGARMEVLYRRRLLTPLQNRVGVGMYLTIATLAVVAGAEWVVVLSTLVYGVFVVAGMASPLHRQIIGHPHGLDLVRGGDEIVSRVRLDDIAGPDVVTGDMGVTLVLWHRDGSRTDLDRTLWRRGEVEALRGELHAWLLDARSLQ